MIYDKNRGIDIKLLKKGKKINFTGGLSIYCLYNDNRSNKSDRRYHSAVLLIKIGKNKLKANYFQQQITKNIY